MGRIEEIVTPRKNYILRLWLIFGAIMLAFTGFMLWTFRFQASCEGENAEYALIGTEKNRRQIEAFAGTNFLEKMKRLNFPAAAREEFLQAIDDKIAENPAGTFPAGTPLILWLYARGNDRETRDAAVGSFGESLFLREKICFSIEDENGFSIQINPENFKIFWAKDGVAVCGIALFENVPAEKFFFKIEEKIDGKWTKIGTFRLKNPKTPVPEIVENVPVVLDEKARAEHDRLPKIVPKNATIESLSVPKNARFYSSDLRDRKAFGELILQLNDDAELGVPARAWSVENLALEDATGAQANFATRDVFHTNVRFLTDESFEIREGNRLSVPISKTLFPKYADKKTHGVPANAWRVTARLVRTGTFAPEEFIDTFEKLRVGSTSGTSTTRLRFGGETVRVRAFLEKNYFRLIANDVPALVLEIGGASDAKFFWQPFRVKTDKGEDLAPESIVAVAPGIYQYWFMPNRAPASLGLTYTITRAAYISAEIVPAITD